jgi:c-di-GMP-binding flagellar brake protein YcgR
VTEGVTKPVLSQKGHAAKIVDLSETGCAMLAGRGLKKNSRLKIDFYLTDEKRIIVLGTIVNISKTGDDRVSRYHIMYTKIGPQSKNNILIYVYNIFGEREEEDEKMRKRVVSVAPVKKKDELEQERETPEAEEQGEEDREE